LLTYKIGGTGLIIPVSDNFTGLLGRSLGISRTFLLIAGTDYQSRDEGNYKNNSNFFHKKHNIN
jgi:hypothetical protein